MVKNFENGKLKMGFESSLRGGNSRILWESYSVENADVVGNSDVW